MRAPLKKALEEHEKAHDQAIIRKLDGSPVGNHYRPQVQQLDGAGEEDEDLT
jgi:hypothetical protein